MSSLSFLIQISSSCANDGLIFTGGRLVAAAADADAVGAFDNVLTNWARAAGLWPAGDGSGGGGEGFVFGARFLGEFHLELRQRGLKFRVP